MNNPDCFSCKHLLPINKHPWNTGDNKGAISEFTGMFVCTIQSEPELSVEFKDRVAILFDSASHLKGCELHIPL